MLYLPKCFASEGKSITKTFVFGKSDFEDSLDKTFFTGIISFVLSAERFN